MSLVHKVSDLFKGRVYPKNWSTCELVNIASIQNGFPFKSNLFNTNRKGFPLLRIRDIVSSKIETFYDGDYLNDYVVVNGDLIVGMDGDFNHNMWSNEPTLLNQRVCRILPDECYIKKKFLYYGLGDFLKVINDNTSAVTVKHLSSKSIGEIPFPLPPLPEQERIVAKLDKLFAQHEKIKKALDRIPQLLKSFRQQVLTQAVTGKLTEQWREGKELEDFDQLVCRIINNRNEEYQKSIALAQQKGERKPSKAFLFEKPTIDEIQIKLPQTWGQTNIHFLAYVTKLAGFEYTNHFKVTENGDIPIVRAQNVQMGKFEDKNRLYISKEVSDFLVRSQLHGRELLMVFIGAGTGNVCLAPDNERWHLAPNVAKIDFDFVDRKYMFYYLQSDLGVKNVLSRVKATAQPSLSMETIREIVTIVPPIDEQQEIVRCVESLFAKADAIESRYQTLKAKIDNLPQAILHKAFKGELVPQLPTDGDAKDLLDEILALKKEVKGKKR